MKVRFVFMTRATGLMVHLLPDVMYIEPSDNSRAIVIGVLNMHLSFKFYRKKKALEDTMLHKSEQLNKAVEGAKEAINTDLMKGINKLAKQWAMLTKGGKE